MATISISPTSRSMSASGGSGTLTITDSSGAWHSTPQTDDNWGAVRKKSSGSWSDWFVFGASESVSDGLSLHAPDVKIFSGYSELSPQTAFSSYMEARHPLIDAGVGAEFVLMTYSKRRGRIGDTSTKRYPTYRDGWGEARGSKATSAPLTFSSQVTLDTLRTYIVQHYCCMSGVSNSTVRAMTYSTFRSTGHTGYFGEWDYIQPSHLRKCKTFGIAVRYENPVWADVVTGTVAETTRAVTYNNQLVRRYIYSDVFPFRVFLHQSAPYAGADTLNNMGIRLGIK